MTKERSTLPLYLESSSWNWTARRVSSLAYYGFLFLLLGSNTHCRKSSPPPNILPPVTQEGKNTFGCKVKGEVWIPYFHCTVFTGSCKELGFSVYHSDTTHQLPLYFSLSTRRATSDTTFSSFDLYSVGAINKTGNVIDSVVILYHALGSSEYYRYPPSNTSGVLNFTKLDTINRIIAGTFSFTLYNTWNDSVVVTDGRFDLTYNACLCH
jgi:hypothetical protein